MDDVGSYSLCSRLQASKPFSFARVSNDPVGCVGCERDKIREELYNEIVDLVDLVLLMKTTPKDINPEYHALSLRNYASLDNDFTLTCKLEHQEGDLRTFQAWTVPFKVKGCPMSVVSTRRCHGPFALLPYSEWACFSFAQVSEPRDDSNCNCVSSVAIRAVSTWSCWSVSCICSGFVKTFSLSMHKHYSANTVNFVRIVVDQST